jgi:hypothetical protein
MSDVDLYTLISLEDFKAVLGIDDRDDKLAKFCLVTSTCSIEHYCKRRLLRKKHFERIEFTGDLLLPMKEYPVINVFAVYTMGNGVKNLHPCGFLTSKFATQTSAKALVTPPSMAEGILEPEFYSVVPDCGNDIDLPFALSLSPALKKYRGLITALKVVYWAGYSNNIEQITENKEKRIRVGNVPIDLASACLELASWNFSRYKGRRIGMSGNIKGAGIQGEHFELSMPENVLTILEPYKRKLI